MNRNEVRDEIAAALEQVAGRSYVVRIEVALANTAKQLRETEAAELRAAGAPPPSLVERARVKAGIAGEPHRELLLDLADALEAAQADSRRLDALERHRIGSRDLFAYKTLREYGDALAAAMERKP